MLHCQHVPRVRAKKPKVYERSTMASLHRRTYAIPISKSSPHCYLTDPARQTTRPRRFTDLDLSLSPLHHVCHHHPLSWTQTATVNSPRIRSAAPCRRYAPPRSGTHAATTTTTLISDTNVQDHLARRIFPQRPEYHPHFERPPIHEYSSECLQTKSNVFSEL